MSIGWRLICYLRLGFRVVDQDHLRAFLGRSDLEHRFEWRLGFDRYDHVLLRVELAVREHDREAEMLS